LDIVIEFKFAAHRLLSDFDANVKQFGDIDLGPVYEPPEPNAIG
jgi:hypothetical protein